MVHAPSHYIDVVMTAESVASGVSVSTMHQQQNQPWDMRADVLQQNYRSSMVCDGYCAKYL